MAFNTGMRALWLAGAILLPDVVPASPAHAQVQAVADYDLPAQDLGETLRSIARVSGQEILFVSETVRGRTAPAVKGRLTADEAVRAALAGTSLTADHRSGALLVRKAPEQKAPEQVPQAPARSGDGAITVTGTRIRGAGSASPVIVATRQSLERAGVSDLADFTRILPQNYTGGQNRGIAGGGEQGGQQNLNDSAALNLRGLGPDATLTLLNGHRLSYDALDQGVDISAIPLSAIERIEVVADGASALYGSDAVAGVANIILRRDFDGLETMARIGGATSGGDFQKQYNAVGGRRWNSGGFMLALDHSHATEISAGQRDYTRSVDPSLFLTDRIRQTSGVLAGHQQIAPGLSLEMDGTAMNRASLWQNPFFPDADVRVSGIVSHNHVRSWSLAPTLRADLGGWQASLGGTAAGSRTFLEADTYFNATPTNNHLLYADGLRGIEANAEGPLFALPGGAARLAVGGGLREISLHVRQQVDRGGQSITTTDFTERRNVRFAYGELSLPFVGPDLGVPLVDRLTLSAALRYEHWNAIASVTTPKLGLVYEPAAGVLLRATWGKSFKIPTLLQVNEVPQGQLLPGFIFAPPPQPAGSPVLLRNGSASNLRPERATTWSATVELAPHVLPGLDLRATYFHVDYRDRIASPLTSVLTALYNPLYSDLIVYNPSAAEVEAVIAGLPGGLVNQTGAPFDPSAVGAIIDSSIRNTERQRIRGIDLGADYRLDLGRHGKLLLTGAASYLESSQQLASGQPVIPLAGTIFNPPHWRARGGAVWNVGRAGFSAFVNYLGPRTDSRFVTARTIGAFVTLDLNATLRTGATAGPLRNIEVRLSALNLLNQEPHFIRNAAPEAAPYDSTNESPVGRFLGVSVRKSW
jgi:outer membrane receptor protein involved in Fe transport